MTYLKINLSQPAYWVIIFALVISAGCTTIDHKQIETSEASRVLSIGSVQSTVHHDEKPISLIAGSKAAGYLMCFYQNQTKNSVRLYPKRLSKDAHITENAVINLSGQVPFKLTKTPSGLEKVACFLTQQNIDDQLPDTFKQADFISYDISTIKEIFGKVTKDNYHYAEATL